MRTNFYTSPKNIAGKWLVKARDPFLSHWGHATGGYSWCAWSFTSLEAAQAFEKLLRCVGNFQYVGIVRAPYRPRNAAHFTVYDGDSHVAKKDGWLVVEYGDYSLRFSRA